MKVIINPNWSLEDAVEAAWKAHRGGGITSQGYRNNVLRTWGNVVGRQCALEEFNKLVNEYGTKKAFAEALGTSVTSLRSIEKHFLGIPLDKKLEYFPKISKFILNDVVRLDEDRNIEFKEISIGNKNPVSTIVNTVDEYTVAFMNSEGGSIYWGISDRPHVVLGVKLSTFSKDDVQKGIYNKIASIKPSIDPTFFKLIFHNIFSKDCLVDDLYIIEFYVPKSNSRNLYFTGGNETFVRIEGVKQKLLGPAIQDWIERRLFSDSV
jgi:hypothetical protein